MNNDTVESHPSRIDNASYLRQADKNLFFFLKSSLKRLDVTCIYDQDKHICKHSIFLRTKANKITKNNVVLTKKSLISLQ